MAVPMVVCGLKVKNSFVSEYEKPESNRTQFFTLPGKTSLPKNSRNEMTPQIQQMIDQIESKG